MRSKNTKVQLMKPEIIKSLQEQILEKFLDGGSFTNLNPDGTWKSLVKEADGSYIGGIPLNSKILNDFAGHLEDGSKYNLGDNDAGSDMIVFSENNIEDDLNVKIFATWGLMKLGKVRTPPDEMITVNLFYKPYYGKPGYLIFGDYNGLHILKIDEPSSERQKELDQIRSKTDPGIIQ